MHTSFKKGFALPTVLIASVILLSILAISVSATAAVRTTLKTQYYQQLAQMAGEAGVAYAKACLTASENVPQWTDAKPLTPSTDCAGNELSAPTVRALIVAGGGGGGMDMGGGGGGGGVVYNADLPISNQAYTVTVGAGGAGAPAGGTNGQASAHQFTIPAKNGENSSIKPASIPTYGSSSSIPGKSCYSLKLDGTNTDGVYWIDPDTTGPNSPFQAYCDMTYAGGGWTLLMKATRGTTFSYSSSYWSTANTLNESALNRNDGDAKFRSFNESSATDLMARWPDADDRRWLHSSAWSSRTALQGFNEFRNWGNHTSSPYFSTAFSSQPVQAGPPGPSAWGTKLGDLGVSSAAARWGFRFNENGAGVYTSDDAGGGIGLKQGSYSAGDWYSCCGTSGMNRTARVEVYGRDATDTADSSEIVNALGGGSGGSSNHVYMPGAGGAAGGSGGGAGGYSAGGQVPGGLGTAGQGNNGGNSGTQYYSGGGGGAGGVGSSGPAQANGGAGIRYSDISSYYFGGGGGGAAYTLSAGGNGGIGGGGGGAVGTTLGGALGINNGSPGGGGSPSAQTNKPGGNAGANTGGGGGGGSHYNSNNKGGDGGSGIVIISYPTGWITATGGTVTTSGGRTTHTFTSSGTFTVTSSSSAPCPSGPQCFVTQNGNVRSSFSVGRPTLDSDGKAVTIPNTGYTEITRTSNGSVWRTYTQPSVQAAVVPDLCSGATSSTLGWQAAVLTSTQVDYSPTAMAQTISISDTALSLGSTYYRKDFSVTNAGTYNVGVQVSGANDIAYIYVDGNYVTKSEAGALGSGSIALSSGCHNVFVRLTNLSTSFANNAARFEASVIQEGASIPVAVTDRSWRAVAGDTVNFAHKDFDASPSMWGVSRDRFSAQAVNSAWTSISGDVDARWITTVHNYDGSGNSPTTQYSFFRDSRTITVASPTNVKVTYNCDDTCDIYLDGNVIASGQYNNVYTTNVTLTEGVHQFAVSNYNAASGAGFSLSVMRLSDSAVLTRSDMSWLAGFVWSTSSTIPYSYSAAFQPVPNVEPIATVKALVVGGGGSGGTSTGSQGGGGGGGGGGVIYKSSYNVIAGQSYTVTVGAGGAAVAAQSTNGNTGGNSVFDRLTAIGGGGGGNGNNLGSVGLPGGSGGGAGYRGYTLQLGGEGIIGQGYKGGSTLSNNNGGGGGGAGGLGGNTNSGGPSGNGGVGGVGLANTITGTSVTYAKGGDGGTPPGGFAAGAANTGNGGSGVYAAGGSGAGGSGVVIIAYPTGTMTATGGTITTSGGNTIHRFTSSGTFTVTDIPVPVALGANVAPPFSQWTLAGGATYNAGTGEITFPSPGATATSPLIRVNATGVFTYGGDFYATTTAPNWTPLGGYYVQSSFYGIDGTTSATNSVGATGNSCAHSLALNTLVSETTHCAVWAGPNIRYVNYLIGVNDWASPGLKVKNPSIIFN